ncbi:DUF1295 domain-containing protein [Subtercola sp. PAMC28395]|uniref:DUF1295 domain-containing protein n=1 Tax=Subtercola sp. PAMC28395 TaxID=2846775 RepID=UPI001C0D8132|nr:DUF1295 domain-containing protein [Subtercola sp. PAMC28395]QWT23153.1 DUF1295 domain-containing protein [Subtercola sp. PAMC28395]
MGPLGVCLIVSAAVCAVVWILSVATREYSWVDRLWSVVPVAYAWIFAGAAGFTDARLTVVASLITLWGIRLTFNFARKGGYRAGGEDYRWKVLRSQMPPWRFQLFNVFFITLYQNVILLLITLPMLTMFTHRGTEFGPLDLVATVAFLGCLVGETVADQQQWLFQREKARTLASGNVPARGFLTTGLFSVSRHPNFFFEQSQWWVVFFFGCIAAGSIWQWTILGAVLLTTLFLGSTRFTEAISSSKYPNYALYQARTSALIPWFPKRGAAAETA